MANIDADVATRKIGFLGSLKIEVMDVNPTTLSDGDTVNTRLQNPRFGTLVSFAAAGTSISGFLNASNQVVVDKTAGASSNRATALVVGL